MRDQLSLFVRDALLRGVDRQAIRDQLLAAKWQADEVAAALDAYVDVDFPVPVPRPRPYVSARDAFGYLILFTTLYVSAVSFVMLVYTLIHRAVPDATDSYWAVEQGIQTARWNIASLLLAFPLFLWLSRRNYRAARQDPEQRTSKIRKWLTYVTLFAAATMLLCDGITLLYYLLGGEITARFLLKVATVAAVGGAAFGYYLWDLKQDDLKPEERDSRPVGLRVFAAGVSGAVAAAIVAGLFLAGSPVRVRFERLDAQRVEHLIDISSSVDAYWRREEALPESLQILADERLDAPSEVRDPVTGELYPYTPGEGRRYELCADFDLPSPPSAERRSSPFWNHQSGRQCFEVEARPDEENAG